MYDYNTLTQLIPLELLPTKNHHYQFLLVLFKTARPYGLEYEVADSFTKARQKDMTPMQSIDFAYNEWDL
tara:strand:- start:289 stop:498 length:210 start_codon:yes stop_codon:yes gene_type:complete